MEKSSEVQQRITYFVVEYMRRTGHGIGWLALRMGYPYTTLYRKVKQTRPWSVADVEKLAPLLCVSPNSMFGFGGR